MKTTDIMAPIYWNVDGPDGIFNTIDISYMDFNVGLSNPSYEEGRVFYDQTKKALSYYNDESEITVNLGQEFLIRVRNETGVRIDNGSVVYPSGISGSGDVLIGLADASDFNKSRLVGVTTHHIEHNTNGYVTKLGEVGGLDTSLLSPGNLLFLSGTNPGEMTITQPTGGAFITQIAAVKTVDGSDGIIVVDVNTSELSVEVTDTNGFPSDQRTGTTLTFVNGTRTLTIAPTGSSFHFYQNGIKYTKTASENIIITDVEGLHYIYYDVGVLTEVVNPNLGQVDQVIRTKASVTIIYWDAANSEHNYFGDERHSISMSPETHAYLHFTRGAQYLSGLGIGDLIVDGDGDTNSHAQFSVEAGFMADEDIVTNASAIGSTTGLPIYYLSGSSVYSRRAIESGYSVLTDVTAGVGSTGNLVWNEYTGGAWQLTSVPNGDYVLCHVLCINGVSGEDQQIAVVGQAVYGNVIQARAGATTEISAILTGLSVSEIVPLATIIFQTNTGYANAVNARVRPTDDGNYVDWRSTELSQGVAATSHSNLTNLSADDHPQYSLISSQAGVPSTTPSRVGLINIDTTSSNAYISIGTSSSSDWVRINN